MILMYIPNISGDCQIKGYEDWIVCDSIDISGSKAAQLDSPKVGSGSRREKDPEKKALQERLVALERSQEKAVEVINDNEREKEKDHTPEMKLSIDRTIDRASENLLKLALACRDKTHPDAPKWAIGDMMIEVHIVATGEQVQRSANLTNPKTSSPTSVYPYVRLKFDQVVLNSFELKMDSGERTEETLEFSYGALAMAYRPEYGTQGTTVWTPTRGWNVKDNKTFV